MIAPPVQFAIGLVAGILASYADLRAAVLAAVALLAGVAGVAALRLCGGASRRRAAALALVPMAGAGLGLFLGERHYRGFEPGHVGEVAGEERTVAVLEGVICEEPTFRVHEHLRWTSLRLDAEAVTIGGERRPTSGRLAAYVWWDEFPPARYGQRVRLSGTLARPDGPLNPGEVDRRAAYAHERIRAVLSVPRYGAFEVLEEGAGNPVKAALLALKARLRTALHEAAPGEAGGFLDSILLGSREELDAATRDAFVRTGTVHVLAISGMHLSLLGGLLWMALAGVLRLPLRVTIAIVLAFAVVYCGVTGAAPSIVRATIMIAIYSIGKLLAREPRTVNSLAVAAIAILLWDPGDLMNVGFQLSFAAILGLDLLYRPLKAWYVSVFPPLGPRPGRARRWTYASARFAGDLVLVSTAAWTATAPLVLWHFHLFTPGTVLANLLIVGPVWVVLSAGMLVLLVAPLSALAATPFAFIAGAAAAVLTAIVEALAAVPGVYAYLGDVRGAQVAASYAALGALAWALGRGRRPRWALAVAPLVAAAVLVPAGGGPEPGEARVAVLAVGRGLATVVRTSSATVLFDCGSGRVVEPGPRFVAPYLWRAGVGSIDAIFLSHPHADHMNAVLAVADRFPVGRVYVNAGFADTPGGASIAGALGKRGIEVVPLAAGSTVPDLGGIDVRVLWPPPGEVRGAGRAPGAPGGRAGAGGTGGGARARRERVRDEQNDRSLVLRVSAGGHAILFPGDLEEDGMRGLVAACSPEAIEADVLLVPHHGSANRHTPAFAARVRPRVAIASTKDRFASANVLCAYEDLGAGVIETWATGCVELSLRAGALAVRAFAGGLPPIPGGRPAPGGPLGDSGGGAGARSGATPALAPPGRSRLAFGVDEERARRRIAFGIDEERPRRRIAFGVDEERIEVRRMIVRGAAASEPEVREAGALAGAHARAAVVGAGTADGLVFAIGAARLEWSASPPPRAPPGTDEDGRRRRSRSEIVRRVRIRDEVAVAAAHARSAVIRASPAGLGQGRPGMGRPP